MTPHLLQVPSMVPLSSSLSPSTLHWYTVAYTALAWPMSSHQRSQGPPDISSLWDFMATQANLIPRHPALCDCQTRRGESHLHCAYSLLLNRSLGIQKRMCRTLFSRRSPDPHTATADTAQAQADLEADHSAREQARAATGRLSM
ncbi:hypothetical protein B0H14DRAFT_2610521 [Mycena olivaceomarginata]|nr:hypothetical protein B0H14DRAFT_2610521 [Mycena olivaceomarginata]